MIAALALLASQVATDGPPLAVFDTFVSREEPEVDFGRDLYLESGPGKAILLRFEGLEPGTYSNSRLILSLDSATDLRLRSASLVPAAWHEGPGGRGLAPLESALTTTWRQSMDRGWADGGAGGAPLAGLNLVEEGGKLFIAGLDAALNQWANRPLENYGLRLEFESPVRVASSDLPDLAPQLRFDYAAPAPAAGDDLAVGDPYPLGGEWVAEVQGTGAFEAVWTLDGETLQVTPVQAGTSQVRLALPASAKGTLRVEVRTPSPDPTPWNNLAESPLNGVAVPVGDAVWNALIHRLNRVILPKSRYSFARDGVATRFRLDPNAALPAGVPSPDPSDLRLMVAVALAAAGVPWEEVWTESPRNDPYGGLLGWGDCRDDSRVNPSLSFGDGESAPSGFLAPDHGGINRTTAARLSQVVATPPGVMLLRLRTLWGDSLGGAQARLLAEDGTLIKEGTTGDRGTLLIPTPDLPQDPTRFLSLELDRSGAIGQLAVPVWRLLDEALRGPGAAGIVEFRVSMPEVALGEGDLLEGRVPTDSAGAFPAQLVALVDGDPATSHLFAPGASRTLEFDLSRDRAIAALELDFEGPIPANLGLRVTVTNTGQTGAPREWSAVPALARGAQEGTVTLYGPATLARRLRLEWIGEAAFTLKAVRLVPAAPGMGG